MRSATIISAVLAAGAFATPLAQKRDVVVETQVNVVYTTLVVDGSGATAAAAPAPTSAPAPAPVIPGAPHLVQHHHEKAAPASGSAPVVPGAPHLVQHHHEKAAPTIPGAPHLVQHHHEKTQPASGSAPNIAGAPHLVQHHYEKPQVAPAAPVDPYTAAGLEQHNLHRKNHSAPAMTWDKDLAASAAALAATCNFEHDVTLGPASNYGQNIASSYPATGSTANELKTVITNMWYNGEVNYFDALYGEESPNMAKFRHWGHFTQVIWKHSTKVGCHTQDCPSMGYFTVCNYGEAGNIVGEFAQNVLPSHGEPTIEISA